MGLRQTNPQMDDYVWIRVSESDTIINSCYAKWPGHDLYLRNFPG